MIQKNIERLLNFAVSNKLICNDDKIQMRNLLLSELKVKEPFEGEVPEEQLENPTTILNEILTYCSENKIIPDNSVTYRDLMDAKIMGILTPRQSETIRIFNENYNKSPETATDEFYALSKANNYIQTERIKKNLYWTAETEYGNLEITINLSKPEKDPKEIEKAKNAPQTKYPKCLLCVQNVGYEGNLNHPARQNIRVIPMSLDGETWYFQYSPYVYYNEHCILLSENHVPMKITEKTIKRALQFIQKFPHYFIGSNADLPIVGGSILSHDHYQGGRHIFPMQVAAEEQQYEHSQFPQVQISRIKWPMSVIRLKCSDINILTDAAMYIANSWKNYSDEEADILAHTDNSHNTITPIARRNKTGFELDIVLRNNRSTEQYPLGIFHPHQNLHHIKKENIGLIEVMGLAVLPGRLDYELNCVKKILTGEQNEISNELSKHTDWINQLKKQYGINNGEKQAQKIIQNEIGQKFMNVLLDAGVFKRTEQGLKSFDKFMASINANLK